MPSIFRMACTFGLALAAGSAVAEPCRVERLTALDLVSRAPESPRIAGIANGVPAEFMIDTGGAWSAMPSLQSMGLPRRPLPPGRLFFDAAGAPITTRVDVPMLEFGPFKVADVQFIEGAGASLGANILSVFDLELDPIARKAVLGRIPPALKDCNAALAMAPRASEIIDSRGYAYLKAGMLDAAIADYDVALALDPQSAFSFYGRSLARRRKGDAAGADADRAAACKIDAKIETELPA